MTDANSTNANAQPNGQPNEPPNEQQQHFTLTASYTSLTNEHFRITKDIPAVSGNSILEEKIRYLNRLRQAVVATQEQVNKELTARMEEDKARESKEAQAAATANDAKEEENYGEEVVEEEN